MFAYYLDLALRSLKRNKVLTALMVLAIGLGIGAAMTTLTVWHVLSGNPLPGTSAHVHRVEIDPQDLNGYVPGQPPPVQVTWIDGMNLLREGRAEQQALMTGGTVSVYPTSRNVRAFRARARYTSAGFFPMFKVPFLYGHAWSAAADRKHARVVVISHRLNDRLFGGSDSVGKMLDINGQALRIAGVLDDWHPNPRFYDLTSGAYGNAEAVFIPLTTSRDLHALHIGQTSCWGNASMRQSELEHASCTWLQLWVALPSPAKAAAYKRFLVRYSKQQKALGRFARPPNVRLPNVMAWLQNHHVVPEAVRLEVWLAFGFLLVCLVNTVGLLLAKFLRRANTLAVRRAMGASRRAVFAQLLIESGLVGVVGGLVGLLLAWAGLWFVRQQPTAYAALAHLDGRMLAVTIGLAVLATLVAGLLPAWRACRVAPALAIKEP